jgi:hypothetical protein
MRVAICDGGVMGLHRVFPHSACDRCDRLRTRTEVAQSGLLALDWCSGSPLDALARRSFGLQATLPHEMRAIGAFVA